MPLRAAMQLQGVPAVSVAVVRRFQLATAIARGVRRAGETRRITARTLFQAASISKSLAALVALRLVDDGVLVLDADVDRHLRSWHIPPSAYMARKKVTLRRLLAMTSGLNVHHFFGYPPGKPLPTLVEILNGTAPAPDQEPAPVGLESVPGTTYAYSGGGYEVVEQLIEDATGERYAQVASRLVCTPLGMRRSVLLQPLPERLAPEAAWGHHGPGIPLPEGWRVYPQLAAAGLWTTPSDVARMLADLMRADAGGDGILPPHHAREMFTNEDGHEYGALGFVVQGSARDRFFMKQARSRGYTAWLVGRVRRGDAIIVMANSSAKAGELLVQTIIRTLAQNLGWPDAFSLRDG